MSCCIIFAFTPPAIAADYFRHRRHSASASYYDYRLMHYRLFSPFWRARCRRHAMFDAFSPISHYAITTLRGHFDIDD
jgi:hypothetical protein